MNLRALLNNEPWCVAYAAACFHSEDARDGWFDLGSNDGIVVWLNGEPVWRKDAFRHALPQQDCVAVRFRRGWNHILLKVGQANGEWGFYFRVLDADGQPMARLEARCPEFGPVIW